MGNESKRGWVWEVCDSGSDRSSRFNGNENMNVTRLGYRLRRFRNFLPRKKTWDDPRCFWGYTAVILLLVLIVIVTTVTTLVRGRVSKNKKKKEEEEEKRANSGTAVPIFSRLWISIYIRISDSERARKRHE